MLPDNSEVAELESLYSRNQAQMLAELAETKRKEDIAARPRQFKAAWEQALSKEPDAAAFKTEIGRSTKSAGEIKAALERIGLADKRMKMSDLEMISGP